MDLSSWLNVVMTLTLFSERCAKEYRRRSINLIAFPSDIPADTTDIDLYDNDINSFPDNAFNELNELEILNIGDNKFTELPNLRPVGNTLKRLEMWRCRLTELNADIFNELVVLEKIDLRYCRPINTFPDVPGPGNTLSIILLFGTDYVTFPMFSNYKALADLHFDDTEITTIPEAALATLQLSRELDLERTPITALPFYPKAYENITYLDLADTVVSFFLYP